MRRRRHRGWAPGGTRLVAVFLRGAGYDIGDNLNSALHDLWFALLFRHPECGRWIGEGDRNPVQRHLDTYLELCRHAVLDMAFSKNQNQARL